MKLPVTNKIVRLIAESSGMILVIVLTSLSPVIGQTSCDLITKRIKADGKHITTDNSYFDDVISKVAFYSRNSQGKTFFYAMVTFKSNRDKEYTYLIPHQAMKDYRSKYFMDDADKFWKYIQPHNKELECTPLKRISNKYK